jgi:hypothetical protein
MRLATSGFVTFETCRRTLKRSAYGGRPEVIAHSQNDAIERGHEYFKQTRCD